MGKQNFITLQLLAISGILISILVSMIAFRQFSLPDSKADLTTQGDLVVPYMRLERSSIEVVDGKKWVTVQLLANTGGLPITGADAMIQYEPSILSLNEDDIQSTGAFAVSLVNSIEEGRIDFSVFSEKNRNEPIVQTNADQEIAIATIRFEVINSAVPLTQLELLASPNNLSDSNLILEEEPRPELPTDVLQSVQSAIISL
jgi:hypothetical protein